MADLAVAAGMFTDDEKGFLEESAQRWLAQAESSSRWVVAEGEEGVVGVAFFEPREATDRVWYLTMIVVHPKLQGAGIGRRLLEHCEEALRGERQRLLLVETSSTDKYSGTRRFYARLGFDEVACIPDYFEEGDGMVLFWKKL